MVLFQRTLYLSKDSEGFHHFPGVGVQLFPGGGGGVQMLIQGCGNSKIFYLSKDK